MSNKAWVHKRTTLGIVRFNIPNCPMMEPLGGERNSPFPVQVYELKLASEQDFEKFRVQSHPSWLIELSHEKCGAFLNAIGQVMMKGDLCAEAALDGHDNKEIINIMMQNGIDGEEAKELLEIPLEYIITFNSMDV